MNTCRISLFQVLIFTIALGAALHTAPRHSFAACLTTPSGLVSWWKAEGSANDQTATNNGLFSAGTYGTGIAGQALTFNGTTQFWAPTEKLPTGKDDRSMALWVQITNQVANQSFFAGYGHGDNEFPGQMYALGALSDNTLFFTNWGQAIFGPTLENGRWYHVAVTNSGNSVTLFLDGEPVASGDIELVTSASPFNAGYYDMDRRFDGSVDEIQIYNRALSREEIMEIYKADAGSLCYSLDFSPTALPDASVSAAYNQAITVPNGTQPYAYSIIEGELPPGITLDQYGVLDGTPTKPGGFSFTVSATDANSGSGFHLYSITVAEPVSSANPPVVTAPAATNSPRPTWNWTTGGGGVGIFRTQRGGEAPGGWSQESTATTFTPASDLPEGTHVLFVQEKDGSGLWSFSGSRTVVIDRTPPNTIIDSATPNNPIINAEFFSTLSIAFSAAGETGLAFECRYDSGSFAPCTSPATYNLITGGHTFEVRAVDLAGNVDPTPATYQWSVVGKLVGAAYSWGLNRYGTLGNGSKDNLPHSIASKVNGPIGFTQIAGDESRTFAVRTDGTLWWWGGGGDVATPAEITAITGVMQVTAGGGDAFALKSDGTVWSLADLSLPVQIPGLSGITRIDTEGLHVLALKSDGTVWVWGRNDYGGLGNGTQSPDYNPTPARVLLNDQVTPLGNIVAIAAGTFSSYAVKSDGTVWAWGWNIGGILLSPTQVTIPGNPLIKEIVAGSYHVIALDSSGNVWGWGNNEWGQTGGSDTTDYTVTPTQISALTNIRSIAAGGPNSLALSAGNTVWAWGRNDKGQLGTGTYDYIAHFAPVKVAYLSGIEQIAVSSGWVSSTCMALKSAWVTIPIDTLETSSSQHPPNMFTSLALDTQDKVHIAYVKNAPAGMIELKYMTNAGGTWEDRGTIAVVSNVNQASIAVDLEGTAHFSYSYYDFTISSSRLMYARYTGSGFDQRSIDTNGYYNSIVTDGNNKVHISYSSALYLLGIDHKYATNESGDWVTEIINPGATSSTAYCAIGYSPPPALIQGISMAYQRDNTLWVSTKSQTTGSWTHTQVDSTPNSGVWPAIAFDVFGLPQVSYAVGSDWKQTAAQLKYATKDTHGWRKYVVDNIETRTGLYSSIDVTKIPNASLRTVYISYFDAVNMDLKVAVVDYSTGKSSVSSIDTDGYVGEYTSLALDSKGIAHISYFSYEPMEGLKYATNSDFTGPTGTVAIRNNNTYSTTTDIVLSLTCSDTFGIGCWRMQFSHDGITWSEYNPETFAASKNWSLRPGDGTKTVYARFEDAANNWSGGSSTTVFLDTVKPAGTLGIIAASGFTNNRLVLLSTSCSDPGDLNASGCDRMKFSTDGAVYAGTLPIAAESSVFLPAGDGPKTVSAMYLDRAGNESTPVTASVTLDMTAPVTTPSHLTGEKTTALSVTLSCSDGSGSGCGATYYTTDGTVPTVSSPRYSGVPIVMSGLQSSMQLRYFSVDNLGNTETIRTETYTFVANYTALTLDLASPTLVQGGLLDVSGKLTRYPDSEALPNNGMDLSGLPVVITVTGPAGSPCALGCTENTTTYSSLGHYHLQGINRFSHKGMYSIKAGFAGTGLHQPSLSSAQSLLVGTSAGYAVIVEGKVTGDEGLDAHNKTVSRVYEALKERGFVDDNIMYFNYAGVMVPGVDAVPLKESGNPAVKTVRWAIETWAKERMNGSPAPLYLIMVDHGNNNTFYLDPETITPSELKGWLDTLEGGLNGLAKQERRLVILGACYSGSFIYDLRKAPVPGSDGGRIIISSAADNEQSYRGPNEPDGIRSGEFFIEELFKQLKKGLSFTGAFTEAAAQTRTFTAQGSGVAVAANGYGDTSVQHPLLEDNGDGIGSNTLADGVGDGIEAAQAYLGFGLTNASLGPADIKAVAPTRYLPYSAGADTTSLWLEPYSSSAVSSAWLEIKSPATALAGVPGTNQLALDLPTTSLVLQVDGTWTPDAETNPTFTAPGRYEVFYFTRSTNAGISEMKRSVVYKNRSGNTPPAAFNLIAPGGGISLRTEEVNLTWEASSDADGLTYTVQIATDNGFNGIAYQQEGLTSPWHYVDSAALSDHTTYYWRVLAVDGYGEIRYCNQSFSFQTNNANDLPGRIRGYIKDNAVPAGVGVANATVTLKAGAAIVAQAMSGTGGAFVFLVPPGNYNLSATVAGYLDGNGDPFDVAGGGTTDTTVTVTVANPTLQVSTSGSGSGTVTASGGISCTSGSSSGCSATYANGATVTLTATPDWNALFGGWSGASTGSANPLDITMNYHKSLAAAFTPNLQTRVVGGSDYATLQGAYNASADGAVIRARVYTFHENLLFDQNRTVTLDGGKDPAYSATTGTTTVQGSMTIRQGRVNVKGLVALK